MLRRLMAVLATLLTLSGAFGVVAPAPVSAQPLLPVPWLRLEHGCSASGVVPRVRVLGSGFEPGTLVDIRVLVPQPTLLSARVRPVVAAAPRTRTAQSLPVVATAEVDRLGTFEAAFDMPGDGFFGDYELRASTRGGGPERTEVLTMPCQPDAVTVETGCRPADGGGTPDRIIVRGRGFPPGDDTIRIWSPTESAGGIIDARASAGPDGTFSTTIRVAGLSPGIYQVVADSRLDVSARTWFETPCPRLDVRVVPDCGPAGAPPERMSVRVEASGFLPRQRALVIWDTPRSFEVFPTRTDPNGDLVADISPWRRGDGSYGVRVRTELERTDIVRQRSVPFTVPCAPVRARLTATECRRPAIEGEEGLRWQIEVGGRGFRPGDVMVVFDPGGGAPQTFTRQANAQGRLQVTIDPLAGASGRYRIVARQPGSQAPAEAGVAAIHAVSGEAVFRAPCGPREPPPAPAIVESCGPEVPGQEDAYRIAVSGGGFYPGGVVRIAFGSGDDSQVFRAEAREGSYERTISPDGRGPGDHPVRVSQRDIGGNVLATSRRTFFTVPCPIDPSIVIVPEQGPAGYTALVRGRDFRPDSVVTLTWDRGLQAGTAFEVEADADGAFDVYLFILPNDWTGRRTLRAGLPDDPRAFPDVTDVYLVVPGSGTPPGLSGGQIVNRR